MSQPIEDPPREEEEEEEEEEESIDTQELTEKITQFLRKAAKTEKKLAKTKESLVEAWENLEEAEEKLANKQRELEDKIALLKSFMEIPVYEDNNRYRPFVKYFKDNALSSYKSIQAILKTIDEQLIKIHKENANNHELRIMISKALYQEQFPRNTIEDAIAALKNFVELLKQIIRQCHDEKLAKAVVNLEKAIQRFEHDHKQQQQQQQK